MRLIDADALDWWNDLYMTNTNEVGVWVGYREAELFIAQAPTVDAEVVRHGEWIEKQDIYGCAYCSNCDYELLQNNTNYCPNCGAKMDGEEQ